MNREKAPSIVPIAAITVLTLVSWIFFDVLRNLKTEAPAAVPQELLNPINPQLNTKVLDLLQSRIYIDNLTPITNTNENDVNNSNRSAPISTDSSTAE